MLSQLIREALDAHRQRMAGLVTRNMRIIDGAKPRNRAKRMQQVMKRTKPLRDLEEQLERRLRQAVYDESQATGTAVG